MPDQSSDFVERENTWASPFRSIHRIAAAYRGAAARSGHQAAPGDHRRRALGCCSMNVQGSRSSEAS